MLIAFGLGGGFLSSLSLYNSSYTYCRNSDFSIGLFFLLALMIRLGLRSKRFS